MITLYHAPTTRSFRIKWLLVELGTPYKERVIDFYGYDRHQPEYRKINPMGSLPTMDDSGLVLTESGAIINFILGKYGNGRFSHPAGTRQAALVDEWMYWSEGLFAVHQRIYWDHCAPPPGCIINPIPSVGEEGKRQAIRYAGMLEGALGNKGFIVGDSLTGADFMLSFPLFLANLGGWFETLPKIRAYVERFSALPAFQAAIADTMTWLQQMMENPAPRPSFRCTEPDSAPNTA
jgi:glutathione S-transferase